MRARPRCSPSTSSKYEWAEFGWVLEGNRPMVRMCEMAAGPAVKRYRMYGRAL